MQSGEAFTIEKFADALAAGRDIEAKAGSSGKTIKLRHELSGRQIALIKAGGVINSVLAEQDTDSKAA